MNDEQKILLLNKYKSSTLTSEEEILFFAWYSMVHADEFHRLLQEAMPDEAEGIYENASPEFLTILNSRLDTVDKEQGGKSIMMRFHRQGWKVAAAVLLLLISGSVWWVLQENKRDQGRVAVKPVQDVVPGGNGAVLTLANGQVVTLDSLKNGMIGIQNGTSLVLNDGSLSYNAKDAAAISYNTISTPNARQFKLVLPDGSKVWLNAASSLKYPTAFLGKERRVEMTGEAYFEVAKNADMPFKVKVNEQTAIEVLGTHFNVNAYRDESSIRTTLLEGLVKVNKGAAMVTLKPGQQVQVNDQLKVDNTVNINQVVAWKEGTFNFDELGVEEVMRQLARWYNIEVVYERGIPSRKFYGEIGRNLNLSQVLEGLKLSGVNFRIEDGKRLIVLP
jgi:hypothetical protein